MIITNILTAAILSTVWTNASPIQHHLRSDGSAVSQLLQIAPASASCATDPSHECATASQAAPFLIQAMMDHSIHNTAEIAGVLALIAFETTDFKYNTNHFPGRAGQGTRNMQMPEFNLQYAMSIAGLKAQAQALAPSGTTANLGADQLNAIRALVLPDQYSWASAAWFLTTHCAAVRPQLQSGSQAGFEAYMACIGTSTTSDRLAYWTRAKAAFSL